jgi:aminoglycoside phosphotransferase (APT) family kinase protein
LTGAQFAGQLLSHLRTALETPDIQYSEQPSPITGGFDTLIYSLRLDGTSKELCSPLILRVFRADHPSLALAPSERARFESLVQNSIRDHGYPAPRVLHTCAERGVIGAPFVIMERRPGRVMLDLLFRPSLSWLRLPELMAEAHARLHSLDPQPVVRTVRGLGLPIDPLERTDQGALADRIQQTALEGLLPGMRWLVQHQPPEPRSPAVCHGDFHPLNILVHRGEVSGVIDWTYVRIADPAYDVGATIAIFSQGPVDLPAFAHRAVGLFRQWIIARYYRAYRRICTIDRSAVRYYEALRCLGFLVEAGEHRQAGLGVIPRPEKPTAFAAPRTVRSIVTRFREITGLGVSIPDNRLRRDL